MRWTSRVRSGLAAAGVAGLVVGCGQAADPEELPTIPAATPATAPAATADPAGTVQELGAEVTLASLDPSTQVLALAATGPDRLLLLDATDATAQPREVALPGPASDVSAADGTVLVTSGASLLRVDATSGEVSTTALPADTDARSVVALTDGRTAVGTSAGTVLVLDAAGTVTGTAAGLVGADDLVTTPEVLLAVDRRQTALAVVQPGSADSEADLGEALRAGEGATTAVTDRFGRTLVLDTTGGELLAFSTGPLLLRQRFPVPGSPYGLAYDPATDIAWVTLTATNELVGYDVAGGEPEEVYRAPTVDQPDSVAVDSATGTVLVASASGAGVQRVEPGAAA